MTSIPRGARSDPHLAERRGQQHMLLAAAPPAASLGAASQPARAAIKTHAHIVIAGGVLGDGAVAVSFARPLAAPRTR